MKILAAADFHEDQELVDATVEMANSGEFDLFLSPGDFVSRECYEDMVERIEIPAMACTGNWDFDFTPPENDEYQRLFNYILADYEDYKIGMLGAVFPDNYQDEIEEWVEGVNTRKLIMMSHYPPERLGDATVSGTRAGMSGFRKAIMRFKPAIWLCGHIHESFGRYSLMETEVFNCASIESRKGFAIELGEDGVESAEEVELE